MKNDSQNILLFFPTVMSVNMKCVSHHQTSSYFIKIDLLQSNENSDGIMKTSSFTILQILFVHHFDYQN